jgi:hypothetical protein
VKLPQAASPQPSQVFSPLLLRPTTITAISGSILYRLPPIRVSDRAKIFGGTLGTALASRSFQEAISSLHSSHYQPWTCKSLFGLSGYQKFSHNSHYCQPPRPLFKSVTWTLVRCSKMSVTSRPAARRPSAGSSEIILLLTTRRAWYDARIGAAIDQVRFSGRKIFN